MKKNDISIKEIILKHAKWPAIRRKHNISTGDIAKDVGISKKQYHLWEKGLLMKLLKNDLEKFQKVEDALNKRIAEKDKKKR